MFPMQCVRKALKSFELEGHFLHRPDHTPIIDKTRSVSAYAFEIKTWKD